MKCDSNVIYMYGQYKLLKTIWVWFKKTLSIHFNTVQKKKRNKAGELLEKKSDL